MNAPVRVGWAVVLFALHVFIILGSAAIIRLQIPPEIPFNGTIYHSSGSYGCSVVYVGGQPINGTTNVIMDHVVQVNYCTGSVLFAKLTTGRSVATAAYANGKVRYFF